MSFPAFSAIAAGVSSFLAISTIFVHLISAEFLRVSTCCSRRRSFYCTNLSIARRVRIRPGNAVISLVQYYAAVCRLVRGAMASIDSCLARAIAQYTRSIAGTQLQGKTLRYGIGTLLGSRYDLDRLDVTARKGRCASDW
jgi:hypothetical protein